jgi:hypothetical protein
MNLGVEQFCPDDAPKRWEILHLGLWLAVVEVAA